MATLDTLGFEGNNLAEWSSTVSNGTTTIAASSTRAANSSTYSMQCVGDASSQVYGISDTFTAMSVGDTYYVRFYAYFPSNSLGTSSGEHILNIADGTTSRAQLELRTDSSGNINAMGLFVAGAWKPYSFDPGISMDTWTLIEVAYTVHADTGGAQVWIDEVSKSSTLNYDTSAGAGVDNIKLGQMSTGDLFANGGDVYFDDIEIASSGPIGPVASGTAIAVGNVGNSSIAAVTPVTIAAATAFTVGNVGNSSIAGYNPNTVIGTGLWEIGAYIYDVIGEINVNVGNVGDISIRGYTPALKADTTFTVGNVGGVSIASPDPTVTFTQDTVLGNVGAVVIAGFAAVVTGIATAVGGGITRIAMKMATILRR